MSKFFRYRLVQILLSLAMAIGLFSYVTITQQPNQSNRSSNSFISFFSNKSETIQVPLQALYDNDKYDVDSLPQSVDVKLTGPNSLLAIARNTSSIVAIVDLRQLKPGEHIVEVRLKHIDDSLKTSIKPKQIPVTISQHGSRSIAVTTSFNKDAIAEGYHVPDDKATSAVKTARVSGPKQYVDLVDKVVAHVQLTKNSKRKVTKSVNLIALDANGNTIDQVTIEPKVANVTINITSE